MLFAKDKLLSLPTRCHFLSPATGSKKIVQYGGSAGGISIHSVTASTYVQLSLCEDDVLISVHFL